MIRASFTFSSNFIVFHWVQYIVVLLRIPVAMPMAKVGNLHWIWNQTVVEAYYDTMVTTSAKKRLVSTPQPTLDCAAQSRSVELFGALAPPKSKWDLR